MPVAKKNNSVLRGDPRREVLSKAWSAVTALRVAYGASAMTNMGKKIIARSGLGIQHAGGLAKVAGGLTLFAGPAISICLDYLQSDFVKYAKRIAQGRSKLDRIETEFRLQWSRAALHLQRAKDGKPPALVLGGRASGAALRAAHNAYDKELGEICEALTNIVRRNDELRKMYTELDRNWHSISSPKAKKQLDEMIAGLERS